MHDFAISGACLPSISVLDLQTDTPSAFFSPSLYLSIFSLFSA